jgi:hypothetical protein
MLFLCWLIVRTLTRPLVFPGDGDGTKDLEILVLRQQLRVLRARLAVPGSPRLTESCWLRQPRPSQGPVGIVPRHATDAAALGL